VEKGTFEIERRYLIRVAEGLWRTLGQGRPLRQGYVATGSPSVRIRVGESRGPVLTCKAGSGVRRSEVEEVVSPEMAEALFGAAGERIISKVRYVVGRWELDRFGGGLEGLELLEIELDDETEVVPAPPEGIEIMREVTDDNRFTSSGLACMTLDEQRRFVRAAYAEDHPC
jgi:CYTH domain-containing protein